MKATDFFMNTSYDGDLYLECPACGWYATVCHTPNRERNEVSGDLGALLAAAQEHSDVQHAQRSISLPNSDGTP